MARRSKLPPAPPAAVPLTLPVELTIYSVGELHPQWLAWLSQDAAALADDRPAEVQAAAVDQVDAAGLQLLLSLQRALADRGRPLRIQSPSTVLCGACGALGLGDWLQSHTAGTAEGAAA